ALVRQAGVIRGGSLEELVDVASLLSTQPEPRGRRVAVLTNAGGLGILCADACETAGLELPALGEQTVAELAGLLPAEASWANPVDMLGGATAETYARALPVVLADPRVDSAIVLFAPTVTATADVDEAVAAAREVGLPAVVKTAAAGAHKTEVGGIALDLRDENAVRAAAERIGGAVVVQAMIAGGAELLAGVVQDPVFGPLVA